MKELTIGTFADEFKIGVETIRFYHRQGLLTLPESVGSTRKYGPQQHSELLFILKSKECGLSLKDIKTLMSINDNTGPQCETVKSLIDSKIIWIINEIEKLQRANEKLMAVRTSCKECVKDKCKLITNFQVCK